MAFLRRLFQGAAKNKREYPNIRRGLDPLEQWTKIGELGDGSFGKVYKTEHRESGRLAALKRVPIQDELELDDFMVEIDILAECRHPNIVSLYEAYFYDEALWIFIEFCAGGAVDDIIVELDHGLSELQIRCISKQMFQALEFLHESNCIHRDLKAGNILLCQDGSIRLADFGVSARITPKGKQRRDTFIGTPYWMAPEVVLCETNKDYPYDNKADIWSAGITLIELAEVNPPYHEMSPMRVLLKITRNDPPILTHTRKWSKDFHKFLEMCLMKDPPARPSARELQSHPFISGVTDFKSLRVLYQEMRAEVIEVVEDLPADADLETDTEMQFAEFSPPDSPLRLDTPTPVAHAVVPPAHSSELGPVEVAVSDVTSPEPKDNGLGPVPAAISDEGLGPVPAAISDKGLGPVPAPISDEGLGPVPAAISDEGLGPVPAPISDEGLGPVPVAVSEFTTSLGPEPTQIVTFVSPPIGSGPTPFSPGPIPLSPEFIPPEIGPEPIPLESPELVSEQSGAKKTSGENSSTSSGTSTPRGSERGRRESREEQTQGEDNFKYATLSRVRTFKVDGQVLKTTTSRIVDAKTKQTLKDNKRYQEMRKQDFRELKRLQREEMKEGTEFYTRIKIEREAQERKFEIEQQELDKRYENELEVMNRRQRKEIEKLETQHAQQFKSKSKQMKLDQTKQAKKFREKMKDEAKQTLKVAESSVPKSQKKETMSKVKSELSLKKQDQDQQFMNRQADELEYELKKLLDQQKHEMKTLEMGFLDARQDLKRTQTSEDWEMEQRQKQDRHQLLKQHVREAFHMQRHQMHVRHQKEIELQARRDAFQLEELRQKQLLEKRQLPKKLKTEHKAAVAELRKAIRQKKVENDKDKFRQLDDTYVKRSQLETEMMAEKHDNSLETLRAELDANMKELQDIQNEKKMALTQQENSKIKERDEKHTQELREWRTELSQKKQTLEEEFRQQRDEREMFYSLSDSHLVPGRPLKTRSISLPNTDSRATKAKSVSLDMFSAVQERKSNSNSPRVNRISMQPIDEAMFSKGPWPNGNSS